jgi:drug/metabolite transporter (DMT)-like permease
MLAVALGISGVRTPQVTTEDIAAVAVLGIVGTGFAYVLNYQTITVTALAGIALVLAGIALTRRHPKPATEGPRAG